MPPKSHVSDIWDLEEYGKLDVYRWVTPFEIDGKFKFKKYELLGKDFQLPEEPKFHVFDTVKHKKYGIGTICDVWGDYEHFYKVDFDEYISKSIDGHKVVITNVEELTLVKAYEPN